jgi:hypothetical protein
MYRLMFGLASKIIYSSDISYTFYKPSLPSEIFAMFMSNRNYQC